MRRNFQVEGHIVFLGEFGTLDFHNAYTFQCIEYAPVIRVLFKKNRWGFAHHPRAFAIEFTGVSSLKIENLPRDGRGFQVTEIDIKEWEDQGRDLTIFPEERYENTYLALFGNNAAHEDAAVRIRADIAEIRILES